MTLTNQRLTAAGAALTIALAMTGCASAVDLPAPGATTVDGSSDSPSATPGAGTEEPTQQAASCEWDLPQLAAGDPVAPGGTAGDLATVLVGSWQHTHIDEGDGFEAVDEDIRYVFPSAEQLIYCQHVPGATDHAENKVAITLDGSTILPPSPHKGFEALAWSADTMLWGNNYIDGVTYLLVRR